MSTPISSFSGRLDPVRAQHPSFQPAAQPYKQVTDPMQASRAKGHTQSLDFGLQTVSGTDYPPIYWQGKNRIVGGRLDILA